MYYAADENDSLYIAVEKLQQILRASHMIYDTLRYKGIDIDVSADSNPYDIEMIFHLKSEIAKLKNISYK